MAFLKDLTTPKPVYPVITDKSMFMDFVVRNETAEMKNKLWQAVCNHERKGIYSGYTLVGDKFIYLANGNGQWIANPIVGNPAIIGSAIAHQYK